MEMNAVKTQTKLLTWEDYSRSVKQVNTMNKTDKAVKVGQIVEYLSYGQSRKGVVCRVTDNGTLFLTNGRFVFPASVLSVQRTVKPLAY